MKRRDFIKGSAGLLAASAIPFGVSPWSFAAQPPKPESQKAKSVIYVFLAGGPSHTDTFDPKPAAGRNYYGSYATPIPTNNPELFLNQNLKELAKIADKYSVIRSMTHRSNAHEIGQYVMYTGDMTGGKIVYPSFGSMLSYLNPTGYKGQLPPYINLVSPGTRFNEGGFLGANYKPLHTGGSPASSFFEVEGIINKMVSDAELVTKRDLLAAVEAGSAAHVEPNEQVKNLHAYQKDNFELLLGEARKVFDLSKEDEATRSRYGMDDFGQSCLMARRLVEYGVPVVSVIYHGWDTHKEHFKRMDQRLGILDKGLAALIADLDEKKLLDETIVLCGGEFGRTPEVMWEPPWNGGRGHFGAAFSFLVAGGGFEGGKVLGKTDERSEKVVERPVYPADLIASVYTLMGVDPTCTVPHPLFGEVPILPSYGQENQSAGLVAEIFKKNSMA